MEYMNVTLSTHNTERVASSRSALFLRVLNEVEGSVTIQLLSSSSQVETPGFVRCYGGTLNMPSCLLVVRDVGGGNRISLGLDDEHPNIDVYINDVEHPDKVNIRVNNYTEPFQAN